MQPLSSLRLSHASLLFVGPLVAVLGAGKSKARAAIPFKSTGLYAPGEPVAQFKPGKHIGHLTDLNARFIIQSTDAIFP